MKQTEHGKKWIEEVEEGVNEYMETRHEEIIAEKERRGRGVEERQAGKKEEDKEERKQSAAGEDEELKTPRHPKRNNV